MCKIMRLVFTEQEEREWWLDSFKLQHCHGKSITCKQTCMYIIDVSSWNLPTFVAHNFPGVYNMMAAVNTGKLSSFILFCSHCFMWKMPDPEIWCQIVFIFSLICFHFYLCSSVTVSANVLLICIMQYVCSCWSLEGGWKFPSICCAQCNCFWTKPHPG